MDDQIGPLRQAPKDGHVSDVCDFLVHTRVREGDGIVRSTQCNDF